MEKNDEAISDFKATLKVEPAMPKTLFYLGNLYQILGRLQEALECYTSFTTFEKEGHYNDKTTRQYSVKMHESRANVLRILGCSDEASEEKDISQQKVQEKHPYHIAYHLIIKCGDIDAGLVVLDSLLDQNIQNKLGMFDVYALKGFGLMQKRKLEDAIAIFDRALSLTDDLDALVNRSFCYLYTQRYKECIEDCERALVHDPKSLSARHNLVLAAGQLENRDQALKSLNMLLKLEPNDFKALHTRANIHAHMGNYQAQTKDMSLALLLFPKLADSLTCSEEPIKLISTNIVLPPTLLHPGPILFEEKRFSEAIEPLLELLQIRVDALGANHQIVGKTHFILGVAYHEIGKLDESIKHFEKAQKNYIANFDESNYFLIIKINGYLNVLYAARARDKESSNTPLTDFFSESEEHRTNTQIDPSTTSENTESENIPMLKKKK